MNDGALQLALFVAAAMSSLANLWLTTKLYKFEDRLIKRINGTYVKSEVFSVWREQHEKQDDDNHRQIQTLMRRH